MSDWLGTGAAGDAGFTLSRAHWPEVEAGPRRLLVVPIGDSILYVTPLYLRAQSGQLPELKRVIAIYGDRVVMEQTLAGALAALFRRPSTPAVAAPVAAAASIPAIGPVSDHARDALDHYNRAIAKLKAGNWSDFGTELNALGAALTQMNHPPHNP